MLLKKQILIYLLLFTLLFTGCQSPAATETDEVFSKTNFVLGTVVTITLYDNGSEALLDKAFARLLEIENLMSANLEASEIGQINSLAGKEAFIVSDESFEVIKQGLYYGELSSGAFDISMQPVVDLWKIGTKDANIPKAEELEEALAKVAYHKILLDEKEQSVYLTEEGMGIDLGGIAKGYAADELVKLLTSEGVTSAMLNLGGNVFALGTKVDGTAWNIGIQNPFDERNQYFGIASIKHQTVVTSGPYERYFEEDGKRYHHIFDTGTGKPIENDIASVTVIADKSIDGDALSTTLFALGIEEGLKLTETMDGVDCIFVNYDKEVRISSGLKESFTIEDELYTLTP